jgi:8-oxo-dGTP pyrophosphatase MutT (NUDIX family)
MSDIAIVRVERLELAYVPRPWPFASERRVEIDRHFIELKRRHPGVWNGRMLLLHDHAIGEGIFRGAYLETDFASFVAWRDWGFPDSAVRNCFAAGAILGSDGAFVLGVMGPQTANAGKIYFPAGTPDPSDVVGHEVDLAGSIRREIAEETGLRPGDYETEDGWHCVLAQPRIAMIRILHTRETAGGLRARIRAHLARAREPELADIRVVRGPADLDPMMPPFVTAFLTEVWSRAAP